MQPVAVAAARHQAAGELVDDDDLAVLDHVVDVALEEEMGLERLVDVVDHVHVGQVVEVVDRAGIFSDSATPSSWMETVRDFSSIVKCLSLSKRRTSVSIL